jgi:DNA-binding transcriptional MocR family regulator
VSQPKYQRVAASIRAQIADGMLQPGEPAPSGAALARATGYSTLTCRKALDKLINDGALVPGTSPGARPRVPARAPTRGERTLASTARALSESLAARRRGARLTQPQLAEVLGPHLFEGRMLNDTLGGFRPTRSYGSDRFRSRHSVATST